ncbi:MAG TPA: transposase [Solirubrobacterales bacterium]|nr:transposase [Solirubrobacterales bacterium]
MLSLPSSLNELLLLFAPCFSRPTYRTFCALVVGQISQTRLRCVTGMLIGCRLSGVWHHARAHRFFSSARWCVDELGLAVAQLIVEALLGSDQPLVVPIDDTLAKRRGRRVFGCFWHHDATANSRTGSVAWGNNWVTAGINVKPAFCERTVCLLVLFRLWRPRRKEIPKGRPDPERPSKPRLARELLCLLAARFPFRTIHAVGDAAYASGAFADMPANVTITSRLRSDAALNALAPPRPPEGQRGRGRPPKKGARLPKLARIALDPATQWVKSTVRRYGKTEQVMVHTLRCLWYEAFGSKPVQVVIVQDSSRPGGYELALISTDLKASAAQLIERYAERWPTEVAYEEGKEIFGVGNARNRTEQAVQRTVPFQFLAMTLTICWYALHGHHPGDVQEHRQRSPWYLTKTTPSFADMLAKLRRVIIATQFHPGRGCDPKPEEIAHVQQAWAAAGL